MANNQVALRDILAANIAAMKAAMPAPSTNNIKVSTDKVFTFPDGTTSEGPFECVILGWTYLNTLYNKPFRSGEISSPDCWAQHPESDKLEPHESVKKPVHTDCETCPKNAWDSGLGGRGKACRNQIRVALAPPDADAKTQVSILKLAPTSLSGFTKYIGGLLNANVHPMMVVSECGFLKSKDYPVIAWQGTKTESNLEVMSALAAKAQELLARGYEVFDD